MLEWLKTTPVKEARRIAEDIEKALGAKPSIDTAELHRCGRMLRLLGSTLMDYAEKELEPKITKKEPP